MIHFRVDGPFEIEPTQQVVGRAIDHESIRRFWERNSEYAASTGCYVFGFRAGHGMVPVYVGQAKTGFVHECFQPHKLVHYNSALLKRLKGTPIMFFIWRESGTTAAFDACIDEVEHLLIQFAVSRNSQLENKRIADWGIQGVYRSHRGPPSEAAREFRRLLGLDPDSGDADDSEGGAEGE